ncbi:cytochrome P450 [Mycena crocata]|nr:cytochrome P450 [Mycena crocata]
MLLYPEYQVKAQQEIDTVIGTARLPDFADRPDLPLVECILQEVFRWMHIPGGSLMIANIKGMSLDESVYKNAGSFYPERYISQPLGHGEPHFTAVFGFGRRVCPGRYLADNSLWIAIATILASCTISNTVDENGHKIVPPAIMSEGLAR